MPAGDPVTTRSGLRLRVRPATPADEPALAALFAHVAPEDLRFRFLSAVHQVAHEQLAAMLRGDHDLTETFLAFDEESGAPVATAMVAAEETRGTAEVAISVHSGFKARGIGWALLAHVLAFARAHGFARLQSIESRDNRAAIDLECEMGFTMRPYPEDSTLTLIEFDLTGAAA
ncbi:hypothetical protein NX02_20900 [Sphingomonas sanxanigenens DSM 19645 = NX02]|uniref:N-acetyltransferase domain-containing protein n=1 Tax=Sphingomonas sanxanigenens DSM 19645 = NX02 TaxID=1123269 RepID=W0AFC9_9SPHN|nr:hypothetical protein NX02_20900 [Sphingomonas sanxanigenens DSM 19645 = NX02]